MYFYKGKKITFNDPWHDKIKCRLQNTKREKTEIELDGMNE